MSISGQVFDSWNLDVARVFFDGDVEKVECVLSNYKERFDELYREAKQDQQAEVDALLSRAERAEQMVEKLIEAGNDVVLLAYDREYPDVIEWQNLVAEWKAQQ
jgi:hypothetical protein